MSNTPSSLPSRHKWSILMWKMYVFSYSVSPAATNDRAGWRLLPTVVFQEFSNEERCRAAKATLEGSLKEAGAKLKSGFDVRNASETSSGITIGDSSARASGWRIAASAASGSMATSPTARCHFDQGSDSGPARTPVRDVAGIVAIQRHLSRGQGSRRVPLHSSPCTSSTCPGRYLQGS